jgi:hypothetical protein
MSSNEAIEQSRLGKGKTRSDAGLFSLIPPGQGGRCGEVEKVRRARKFRPLFFIDIAVPRDIDPTVGEIEEVYLYDIDTLEQLADEARERRQQQIAECESIIAAELAKLNLPGM